MRALEALDELVLDGIKTNIPLHKELLKDPAEIKGGVSIHYLEHKLEDAQKVEEKKAESSAQK